jgi:hypothetical protein
MHKSAFREAYMQEIQEVFKLTLLDTLVTPVGTPSSGSASDNTVYGLALPSTSGISGAPLGILKPAIDQLIGCLTVIVPLRTTLEKILSSTWVIR